MGECESCWGFGDLILISQDEDDACGRQVGVCVECLSTLGLVLIQRRLLRRRVVELEKLVSDLQTRCCSSEET